jgi:hypothetical protein
LCPEVEQRLVVTRYAARRQQSFRQITGFARAKGPVRHRTREHSADVGVEHRDALPKGE